MVLVAVIIIAVVLVYGRSSSVFSPFRGLSSIPGKDSHGGSVGAGGTEDDAGNMVERADYILLAWEASKLNLI